MSTLEEVTTIARTYLRDFPRFFQTTFAVAGRTYQLGHVNIDAESLYIAAYVPGGASASAVTNYTLDERNGIVRLATNPTGTSVQLLVEGYYYEWVTPADLEFYAKRAIDKHVHTLSTPLENLSTVVIDVIGIAAIVEALWALMTEYSRDIDVITSESVHIPASQRFRMVQALLAQWEEEYRKSAKALNIGLERMEVFTLRRTSRLTNRLVPVYKPKELGDYGPLERVWTPIDDHTLDVEKKGDDLRTDVYIESEPQPGGMTPNAFF